MKIPDGCTAGVYQTGASVNNDTAIENLGETAVKPKSPPPEKRHSFIFCAHLRISRLFAFSVAFNSVFMQHPG